jgi:tetratricopeptide (TPR) repeat protein
MTGRDQEALTTILDAIDLAHDAGDVVTEWRAQLELAFLRGFYRGDRFTGSAPDVAERAIAALGPLHDHRGLTYAWVIIGMAAEARGELAQAGAAYRRARYHARRSPGSPNGGQIAWGLAGCYLDGAMPVTVALHRCRQLVDWRGNAIPGVLLTLAVLLAMDADFEQARAMVDQGGQIFDEWGHLRGPVYAALARGRVELLARDAAAAEQHARRGLELSARLGGDENDVDNALVLAWSLCRQRRFDEAEAVAAKHSRSTTAPDGGRAATWMALRAQVLMHRSEWRVAGRLAGEAVRAVDQTELFNLRAELRLTLAGALLGQTDSRAARTVATEALQLFDIKGNIVGAASARQLLHDVSQGSSDETT